MSGDCDYCNGTGKVTASAALDDQGDPVVSRCWFCDGTGVSPA